MIHIVLPMAGNGQRFRDGGYTILKPLIELNGKKLFEYAYESVKIIPHKAYALIKVADNPNGAFEAEIKKAIPNISVTELLTDTLGPADTVSRVIDRIPSNEALLLLDCDLEFRADAFLKCITDFERECDGALVTFEASDPRYSYVLEEDGVAQEVAEKKTISRNAICGAYFFSRAEIFHENYCHLKNNTIDGEHYISSVIQEAIKQGRRFDVFEADYYRSLGTPQEINQTIIS